MVHVPSPLVAETFFDLQLAGLGVHQRMEDGGLEYHGLTNERERSDSTCLPNMCKEKRCVHRDMDALNEG